MRHDTFLWRVLVHFILHWPVFLLPLDFHNSLWLLHVLLPSACLWVRCLVHFFTNNHRESSNWIKLSSLTHFFGNTFFYDPRICLLICLQRIKHAHAITCFVEFHLRYCWCEWLWITFILISFVFSFGTTLKNHWLISELSSVSCFFSIFIINAR